MNKGRRWFITLDHELSPLDIVKLKRKVKTYNISLQCFFFHLDQLKRNQTNNLPQRHRIPILNILYKLYIIKVD
jgi:hypothetical protein